MRASDTPSNMSITEETRRLSSQFKELAVAYDLTTKPAASYKNLLAICKREQPELARQAELSLSELQKYKTRHYKKQKTSLHDQKSFSNLVCEERARQCRMMLSSLALHMQNKVNALIHHISNPPDEQIAHTLEQLKLVSSLLERLSRGYQEKNSAKSLYKYQFKTMKKLDNDKAQEVNDALMKAAQLPVPKAKSRKKTAAVSPDENTRRKLILMGYYVKEITAQFFLSLSNQLDALFPLKKSESLTTSKSYFSYEINSASETVTDTENESENESESESESEIETENTGEFSVTVFDPAPIITVTPSNCIDNHFLIALSPMAAQGYISHSVFSPVVRPAHGAKTRKRIMVENDYDGVPTTDFQIKL